MHPSFVEGFEKQALKLEDIEDSLGHYIRGKHKDYTEKRIAEEKAKSTGLSHPWLTGLPTLGIWPAIARQKATEKIHHDLLRNNKDLHDSILKYEERAKELEHKRDVELQDLMKEQEKTMRHQGLMNTGSLAALGLAQTLKKKPEEEKDPTSF